MEMVLCRDHRGAVVSRFLHGWFLHGWQRQFPVADVGRELREEMCWPLNSRNDADFIADIKLSHQRRCLRRNLPLLEAQGSVTEAKPSRWPRLETEPKTNPSPWRGGCTQLLFCSGEQQCDTYTDLHHDKDSKQTLWEYWLSLSPLNRVGDASPGVTNAMPELELLPWISLSLKRQDCPGQVISSSAQGLGRVPLIPSAFQLRTMAIHSVQP